MKTPVIIVGIGEMAGVFARGLLRSGHPIFPITRTMELQREAEELPAAQAVVVAVAEKDLHSTLEAMPQAWRGNLVLLQNELLPRDWQRHQISNPTVISVWFEKKPGQDYKVLIPSAVFGPNAGLIHEALEAISIPCRILASADELQYELIRKNVYILTTNIAGLISRGNVEQLWQQHQDLARQVANEVMDIQAWLTDSEPQRERLIAGMLEAMEGDPQHGCTGRSAPARLQRALQHADEAGLAVPTLRDIWQQSQT